MLNDFGSVPVRSEAYVLLSSECELMIHHVSHASLLQSHMKLLIGLSISIVQGFV